MSLIPFAPFLLLNSYFPLKVEEPVLTWAWT